MIQTARPSRSLTRCAGCHRPPVVVTTLGSNQLHIECPRCGMTTQRHHSLWLAAAEWDAGRLQPIADTPHADTSPEAVLLRLRATLAHHRAGLAAQLTSPAAKAA